MPGATSERHCRHVGEQAGALQEDTMQPYPNTALDAELAYRRERISAEFRRIHDNSHATNRGLAGRLRRHRRDDQHAT